MRTCVLGIVDEGRFFGDGKRNEEDVEANDQDATYDCDDDERR